uniref:Secreted protein n=1 Tax=Bursaphelenchus xylophilus TaxID=6326 RepID=A0A1I7S974_BURXY
MVSFPFKQPQVVVSFQFFATHILLTLCLLFFPVVSANCWARMMWALQVLFGCKSHHGVVVGELYRLHNPFDSHLPFDGVL